MCILNYTCLWLKALCFALQFPKGRVLLGVTCGTHLGDTKLVTSITGSPASDSLLMNSTFTDVGTMFWTKFNSKDTCSQSVPVGQ